MKRLCRFFIPVFFIASLSSCTSLVHSHSEIMGNFKTKEDVISSFGLPDEKIEEGNYTQWLFNYGKGSDGIGIGNSRTNASVYGNENSVYGQANTHTSLVTRFSEYNKFVKFTFDNEDRVVSRSSQGVDLSERKSSVGKTLLYVGTVVAVGAALGILIAGTE